MSEYDFMEKLKRSYVEAIINDARYKFMNPKGAESLIKNTVLNYDKTRGYISRGVCPKCNGESVFFNIYYPWKVKCSSLFICNYSETTESLYPEVVQKLNKEYQTSLEKINKNSLVDRLIGVLL